MQFRSIWGRRAAIGFLVALPNMAVHAQETGNAAGIQHSQAASEHQLRQLLQKTITIELRDSTLLEALFTIRDSSGINIVIGSDIAGNVSASFQNAPVHQVLDSLLITRGYGYRIVSGSLVVSSLEDLGGQLPLFERAIIRTQSAQAEDLVESVKSLLSPEGRVHSVPSSNSLMIIDYPERIAEIRKQVQALENAALEFRNSRSGMILPSSDSSNDQTANAPSMDAHVVRVFQPQFVSATILLEALKPLLSPTGQITPLPLEDKILISDLPSYVERIDQALRQLDQPRPQVRIRALIYDCSLEDVDRLGVNWNSSVQGSNLTAAGVPNQSLTMNTMTATVTPNAANGVMTLSSLNKNINLNGVLQALETADDSRLLADPNVVVMNHEEARISIVTEVPYQQLTQGIQGGTIGTTDFREAGVKLTVTPHIAQDGTISMVVNPEFSILTGFTEQNAAPIIDRRATSTTVRVRDGQTLVLGGLRQRTRNTERSEIPGLGRIPYLGRLFRFKRLATRDSELIVFLTPEIVCPEYCGNPREQCIGETVGYDIEQTPTNPIPFGMESVRAEDQARTKALDDLHGWKFGRPKNVRVLEPGEQYIVPFEVESNDAVHSPGVSALPYSPQPASGLPTEPVRVLPPTSG